MAMTAHLNFRRSSQSGFGMIEILVTVLVFAIGLLGLAAMQIQSLKGTSDSGQRSKAVWLAQEMAERMRANPDGVDDGDYLAAPANGSNCGAAPAKYCSNYYDGAATQNTGGGCNSQEMATFDVWELACGYNNAGGNNNRGNLVDYLASPTLTLACPGADCPDNDDYTITVTWLGRGEGNNDTQRVQLTVRP